MRSRNTYRFGSFLALVVLAALAVPAFADDEKDKDSSSDSKESKAKVAGNWKWSFTTANGETRETTAKFKQEGDKVTGTVSGRQGNETEIKDGKLDKDGKLTFTIEREFNGNKIIQKYNGKVEGDTIKGKVETTRNDGESRERDWEAKRAKDEDKDKKDEDKKDEDKKDDKDEDDEGEES